MVTVDDEDERYSGVARPRGESEKKRTYVYDSLGVDGQ